MGREVRIVVFWGCFEWRGTRTFRILETLHILICWLYRSQRVNAPPTMHLIPFIAWMLNLNYKKEKKNPCQVLWLQWRQVQWLVCKAENTYGWLLSNNEVLERHWGSQVAHWVKNPPTSAGDEDTQVWSLSREDTLQKEMATHSSILAWRIPWIEEQGIMGLQRVRLNWATKQRGRERC